MVFFHVAQSSTNSTLGGASMGACRVEFADDSSWNSRPSKVQRSHQTSPARTNNYRIVSVKLHCHSHHLIFATSSAKSFRASWLIPSNNIIAHLLFHFKMGRKSQEKG
jgi:hypothetical protein